MIIKTRRYKVIIIYINITFPHSQELLIMWCKIECICVYDDNDDACMVINFILSLLAFSMT